MLTARLCPVADNEATEIRSDYFVTDGAILRDARGNTIAEHREGMWHGKAGAIVSIEFAERVVLRFAAPEVYVAETYGPLRPLRIAEGGLWHTRSQAEVVAEF